MIEVRDLQFTYPGNKEKTLLGLNFMVQPGEIFGFLGPSGAGKSTTQNILVGILKDYVGSVKVLGQELSGTTPNYYERIGVSFELPNLYAKFTGLENLDFFRSMYSGETEDPRELLAMVGLEQHGNTRVEKWSKGMKMRLNFVRALLNKPDVLFFDEPTSGLDPANARNIKDIILSYKEAGKTIFITTHNMEVAESICDRLAFIVDGDLALTDSPDELKVRMGQQRVRVEYNGRGKEFQEFDLDGLGNDDGFLALLREKKIRTIHTQEATLEDIFIQVTGRKLS
ncbi:MAG: ABC transporter ATP-binding protein [Firmicutes bacterium]|nr:ABC transporter ATP-binding protein [Bacillota bacterium]